MNKCITACSNGHEEKQAEAGGGRKVSPHLQASGDGGREELVGKQCLEGDLGTEKQRGSRAGPGRQAGGEQGRILLRGGIQL